MSRNWHSKLQMNTIGTGIFLVKFGTNLWSYSLSKDTEANYSSHCTTPFGL